MKRAIMAAALLGSLGVSAVASDSSVATWQTLRYGSRQQWDITCSAGAICEVELARGESLNGGQFVGDQEAGQELWQHSSFVEGVPTGRGTEPRPHLTFVASRGNLSASAIVGTSQHIYRFALHSVDGDKPTYASFIYPSQAATPRPAASFIYPSRAATPRPAAPRRRPGAVSGSTHYVSSRRSQPKPQPTPPQAVKSQMDRACASMQGEQYGSDPRPVEWRPARVCHSSTRTFIQLQSSNTVPTDVPIPREVTSTGDANLVWTYDGATRIYGVDLVPNEIVLTLGSGKHEMRMRLQRQIIPPPTVVPHRAK